MQRIVVVGTSCSGKTTFARQVAVKLDLPHIELDALFWLPNWVQRDEGEFRAIVEAEVAQERWVVDGNYKRVRPLVWDRADTIIWLNYSFPRVLWRALARTLRRAFTREELFSGNRESFRQSFLSRESILCWVAKTYHRRRREYHALLDSRAFPQFTAVELRQPREAAAFLDRLAAKD